MPDQNHWRLEVTEDGEAEIVDAAGEPIAEVYNPHRDLWKGRLLALSPQLLTAASHALLLLEGRAPEQVTEDEVKEVLKELISRIGRGNE